MHKIVRFVLLSTLFIASAMAVEDKFFNSNGVRIRYTDQGSGEPVILVHGYSVNQEHEWVETGVLPKLAKDYRVIAIDERGHGKSGAPHDAKAYGIEMGMDVIRLMNYLQIPKAHIIGYSMGSMITSRLLTEYPGRFYTATLGGSTGFHTLTPEFEKGTTARAEALEKGEYTGQIAALNNDPVALAHVIRSIPSLVWDVQKMKQIQVPVLAICGDKDTCVDPGKDLQGILPTTKRVVIAGATHAGATGALSRPEFIGAIQEFLAANRHPIVEDKYFNSMGQKIRYTDQGSGEPVVLIHGYSVNQEHEWVVTGVLPNLARDYRVIAIDVRGFGKSAKPHDPQAYGKEMRDDVFRLLEHLQIGRAHIIGYSMGAGIVAKLLTERPSMFLTATVGGGAGRRNTAPARVPAAGSPQSQLAALEKGELPGDLGARNNDPLAIAAMMKNTSDGSWDEAKMKQIKVPVLAAVGSEDGGLAGAKDLQSVLPSVKLVVIPGATHAGPTGALYRPEFVGAIREFLAASRQPVVEDRYFNSNGVRIRYTDRGAGEPVILVHGSWVNQEHEWVMTGVLPSLAKDYRVIAIDVRGHGMSDKPHDASAYGAEMGLDVIRLMNYLQMPKAHIMGYSMGAGITAKLLATHPGRFYTAILGGGAGRRNTATSGTPQLTAAQNAALLLGELPAGRALLNNDPLAHAARQQADSTWDEAKMRLVKVPVLALGGSNDQLMETSKDLKSVLPSAKLVMIDGATHAGDTGALFRPEFITNVREFLAANRQPVIEDRYFDSNGVKIRYTDQGSGEPVVLIHGFSVNQEHEYVVTGVLPKLVAANYRVVALDSRGHGKSDKPHNAKMYGPEMGMDVIRLMDYLKIPKAHIIGYSLGTMIATRMLTDHPERLVTLTLGGGAGRRNTAAPVGGGGTNMAVTLQSGLLSPDHASRNSDPVALAAVLQGMPEMAYDEAKMRQMKVPILAVIGDKDNIAAVREFKGLFPEAKLVEIEGATHAGPTGALNRPEFVGAIKEFLAAHRLQSAR
jgi:pimeloyl-ACP methyl ester carboxylesterase